MINLKFNGKVNNADKSFREKLRYLDKQEIVFEIVFDNYIIAAIIYDEKLYNKLEFLKYIIIFTLKSIISQFIFL